MPFARWQYRYKAENFGLVMDDVLRFCIFPLMSISKFRSWTRFSPRCTLGGTSGLSPPSGQPGCKPEILDS